MWSFFYGCLFFSVITSAILLWVLLKRRFLLVKPSIWFLAFFNVQLQWSAVLNASTIYETLNNVNAIFVITQIFPFITLLLSINAFLPVSRAVWRKMGQSSSTDYAKEYKTLLLVLIPICLGIVLIYLRFVPLTQTGLYVSLFSDSPLAASIARENSLKLLPYTWLKYLYQFFARFLAIFVSSMLMIRIMNYRKRRFLLHIPLLVSFIAIFLIGASLPGARISGAIIVLSLFATYYFHNRLRIAPGWIILGAVAILAPAILIQLVKYNAGFGFQQIFSASDVLIDRVTLVPLGSGLAWLNYTETHGFWGVRGIPRLASLFGVQPINVANFLMNYYTDSIIRSGFLTTSFAFAYYCYFGWAAILAYPLLILFLDTWTLFYSKLAVPLVVPAIISLNIAAINLIGSDYLTMFITYGFFTGAVLIAFISSLVAGKRRTKTRRAASYY